MLHAVKPMQCSLMLLLSPWLVLANLACQAHPCSTCTLGKGRTAAVEWCNLATCDTGNLAFCCPMQPLPYTSCMH